MQIFPQQKLCEYEGGTWYGLGAPTEYHDCCAVRAAHLPQYPELTLLPDKEYATRNNDYKLVRLEVAQLRGDPMHPDATFNEFYSINERADRPAH